MISTRWGNSGTETQLNQHRSSDGLYGDLVAKAVRRQQFHQVVLQHDDRPAPLPRTLTKDLALKITEKDLLRTKPGRQRPPLSSCRCILPSTAPVTVATVDAAGVSALVPNTRSTIDDDLNAAVQC